MSNWFDHIHLTRLQAVIEQSDCQQCKGFTDPIVRMRFNNLGLIDVYDLAFRAFVRSIGMDADDNWKTPQNVCERLLTFALKNHPGASENPSLDELFELRSSSNGWRELDRFFVHLTGKTLSGIVDNHRILHDADDPGLHGSVCYSAVVHTSGENRIKRRKVFKALASSCERIVPLVVASAQALQTDFAKGESDEPFLVEIKKNGQRQLSVSVIDSKEPGKVDIDWTSIDVDVEDMAMLKALLSIVPEPARLLVKGRFLQGQLGL